MGTLVNVIRQPPPSAACPDVDVLTITFSGIEVDCGCVPQSGSGSQIITDLGTVNRAWTLNRTSPGFWESDSAIEVHILTFPTDDCSGDPGFEGDVNVRANAFCSGSDIGFLLSVLLTNAGLFTATPSAMLTAVPNESICGVTHPFWFVVGAAHGGTATITF